MKRIALFYALVILISCNRNADDNTDMNTDNEARKVVIYQVMTRLFGNTNSTNLKYGTSEENGVGKFSDFSDKALVELKTLGITHMWYTGVLEHAIVADFSTYGIAVDDADVVKGRAGSPYAIKDYYDVNPDLADVIPNRLEEFTQLIDRTHQHGMKVISDFVPNHVARSYGSDTKSEGIKDLGENDDTSKSFDPNNNFYYLNEPFHVPDGYEPIPGFSFITKDGKFQEDPAKATGNDKFEAKPSVYDWFETVKLNYGVDYQNNRTTHFDPIPDTWIKMKDILCHWAGKGVDGFRCDMAEMVPVEFWGWVIPEVQKINPAIIFIAEIYNPEQYVNYINNGQFTFLYDKVELYDTLRHIVERRGSSDNISNIMDGFNKKSISDHMVRFLENHDEQRLASRFFAGNPWKGWPAVVLSATISNGPMMIYFGQEVGEPGLGEEGFQGDDGRTTIFDYWGVPEHQKWMNGGLFDGGKLSEDQLKLRGYYSKLLNACNTYEALYQGNTIDLHQYNMKMEDGYKNTKVYCFLKHAEDETFLVICNFSENKIENLPIVIPDTLRSLRWSENKNLLTDETFGIRVLANSQLRLDLEPYEAALVNIFK